MKPKSVPALIALMLGLAAGASLAGGNHAGGHGSDAIGKPGLVAQAARTVQIDMSDAMRFTPASVDVRQGETVRFIVKNSGQLKHEMVLGSEKELKAHYELMKKHPDMEHADENMVSVAPGQTGEIVWQFTRAGKVEFACLQPGHYEAGMKGAVKVAAKAAAKGAVPKVDGHADHQH